jgi:D-sedoheptulose 7-phosphate isomerase
MSTIHQYVDEIKRTLDSLPWREIEETIGILQQARLHDRQVFIMGNGGSAATASHFACDLGKGTLMAGRPRFRVISLTDNVPLFSALANDLGYDRVFVEQLASLVQPGDVVIGISGSGNSANVLNALALARQVDAITVGFTGFDGGQLKDMVDVCVHVANDCMEQVEDVHLMLEHLICTELRRACGAAEPALSERAQAIALGLRLVDQSHVYEGGGGVETNRIVAPAAGGGGVSA